MTSWVWVTIFSKSLVGPLVFGAFQRAGRSRKHQETAAKKHETAGNKAALERRARACKGKLREHTFLLYTLRAARLGQHQPVSACFEGMAFRCGRSLQGRLQALSAPFVPLLVGCLGGRLWAEVLRAMFMSACGRLWALLRGACGRMWATRTEVLQACMMSACGRLWAALLPLWAFLLAGASRRMWGLFLGAFGCAAHMGACPLPPTSARKHS